MRQIQKMPNNEAVRWVLLMLIVPTFKTPTPPLYTVKIILMSNLLVWYINNELKYRTQIKIIK